VTLGSLAGASAAAAIGGTVQLGHESDNNTWFGLGAGAAITVSANNNVFIGAYAGKSNTMYNANTYVGASAGENSDSYFNTFVGSSAGYLNTSGHQNVFVGMIAGNANTTGSNSTYVGYGAGENATGGQNTMVGAQTGVSTTGTNNAFFGYYAGRANLGAGENSFFGAEAGKNTGVGYRNVFVGTDAGRDNTTGDSNAFVGRYAGYTNTTGYQNTFVGHIAGEGNTVEGGNTFLGSGTKGATSVTNATAVGSLAQVTRSNSLVLGAVAGINGSAADTNVGIGTASPAAKLHVVGAAIITGGVTTSVPEPVPDYVFEPTYTPMTLDEVERFVQREKHLPYVPSAAALKRDGLNLAEVEMGLLKQVEELTLHTVDQAKQLAQQATTFANKDAQIEALSARVAALEALVNRFVRQDK
jgi:trimeric autotransporter adhesin